MNPKNISPIINIQANTGFFTDTSERLMVIPLWAYRLRRREVASKTAGFRKMCH
jgi:hypothetical protein